MCVGEVGRLPPFSEMKTRIAILTAALMLAGCRTKAVTVTAVDRHADSVSALRSIQSHGLHVFSETETIILRQDSTGRLVPVAHDIVRHTEKSTETRQIADTTHFQSQDKETIKKEKETQPAAKKTDNGRGAVFAIVMLLLFTAFVLVLAIYLLKLWKYRN